MNHSNVYTFCGICKSFSISLSIEISFLAENKVANQWNLEQEIFFVLPKIKKIKSLTQTYTRNSQKTQQSNGKTRECRTNRDREKKELTNRYIAKSDGLFGWDKCFWLKFTIK